MHLPLQHCALFVHAAVLCLHTETQLRKYVSQRPLQHSLSLAHYAIVVLGRHCTQVEPSGQ